MSSKKGKQTSDTKSAKSSTRSSKSAKSKTPKSKYSRDDRKQVATLIENLKNNEDYVKIFEILTDDEANSYTHNSNGVFLNLSEVSDKTLDRIHKYMKKVNKKRKELSDEEIDYIPYSDFKEEKTYKLSNYEKNILKQRSLKKVLNDADNYEQMKFSPKKKAKKIED